jgi:membrane-bound lytic murein transglycosylase B
VSCPVAHPIAVLVVALAVLGAVGPADAQDAEPAATAAVSPALDDVEVDGVEYRVVAADYELVRAARRRATARLVALAVQERDLAAGEARAGARARLARTEANRWRRRVANLAVRAYIGAGGDDASTLGGLDPGYTRPERRALLFTEVDRHWRANLAATQGELIAAEVQRDQLGNRHEEVVADQDRTEQARAEALAEERRLRPTVEAARATATVVGSDLTLVALDAYLRAALEVNDELPGCRLPWWLLAGIGRVESGHGTFATSELDAGGTARPSIIGIALDGGNSTAVITDTDGGTLDGDTRSDRAVGPMQFIPSTWSRYAADGNGDGVADPQNLYDAAHAAGQYLCTAAGDLGTDAGIRRGIYAYNHSDAYVAKVLDFTREYVHLLA